MEIISRKEAKEKGLKRYFTGKPCKYGHVSERYMYGGCVECRKESAKEYNKGWYQRNKEYKKEYIKQWFQDNKEHRNEYRKDYERNRYATDDCYKTLRVCQQIIHRTLRATNSTKDTHTHEMLGYCNEQLKESIESKFLQDMSWESYGDWHIDHIYPVTRYIKEGVEDPSVINHLDNLIPMWAEHNFEKSDRTLEEYLDDRKDLVELYGRFL